MINFFAENGPLSGLMPGYKPRPAQITMATAIKRTLTQRGGRVMIEAGTGTGKSLAYLVPALQSGKKILISTATKTLQDQLFNKDLPLALKATGLDKRTLLMKGRSNYLCLLKADQFMPSGDLLDKREHKRIDDIRRWIDATETGDRAELTSLPEDSPWWHDLSATSDSCIGQKCPFFSDCHVTRMRRKAQGADILVVNHALLCSDQRNEDGFGKIIPDAEVWILDEAHALEDVATNAFGIEITGRQVRYLARDLQGAFPHIPPHNHTQYQQALDALLPAFLKICEGFGNSESRTALDSLKPELMFLEVALASTKLDLLARRVHKLTSDLHFMLSREAADAGYVIFVDRDNRGSLLRAAPIEPAQILKKTLWETEAPIVFTSATLAIQKSLEPFAKRIGLESPEGHILETPFDTLSQSALYIPSFVSSVEKEIESLVKIAGGGTFLLFTSHRALNEAYEKLLPIFESQGLQVFKQGDKPKLELVRDFAEADTNFGGVLFATHSFWEGVDVQGKALRLVVIDKLPFKSPEDPIHKARSEHLERQGISSFYGLSVPHAALTLKQGVGRLLRTHTDRGIVAILDSRLIQKGYGRVFLDTLSPMTRVNQLDDLRSFV